jgi:hypothetical protein
MAISPVFRRRYSSPARRPVSQRRGAYTQKYACGYAGVDSESVVIEGDLLEPGRLKNLKDVHLNKNGIYDDDLKFVALLPEIQTLEFNADNGYDEAPSCTDRSERPLHRTLNAAHLQRSISRRFHRSELRSDAIC